jgi:hypothetical protein
MKHELSRETIANSLRLFKSRRDDLLHEDVAVFDHHLQRFIELCSSDQLVCRVLHDLLLKVNVDTKQWWECALDYENAKLNFPTDSDEELILRLKILENVVENPQYLPNLGAIHGARKRDDWINLFRTLIVRPFVDELSHRLGDAADLASPDARSLQAVPLNRIPTDKEVKIFLSHKSVDKPLVYRYYHALREVKFSPWLDEPDMAAGVSLEREIFRGFEESCAAVFFITDNFKDEKYLAAEVEYAIMQKRKKRKKFAIITLRYSNAAPVPDLLTPYIYKDVENDLQGFFELLRALPVELGPLRWKADVVS